MQFTTTKQNLLPALARLEAVAEKKNTIPILSNLLIDAGDALRLTATDLDVTLRLAADADIKQAGKLCAPARKLFEIVRSLADGDIEISAADEQLTIKQGRSRFRLAGVDAQNFPETHFAAEYPLSVPGAVLATLFNRTSYAITKKESRYSLNGLRFEAGAGRLRAVTTDGHRLALCDVAHDGAAELAVLIPRRALKPLAELAAPEAMDLAVGGNHLHARAGRAQFSTRLLTGEFPNYDAVLPTDKRPSLLADRAALLAAVRRVALVADEKSHALKLSLTANALRLSAVSAELGEGVDELDCEYDGPAVELGLNAQYLLEAVEVIDCAQVDMRVKDGNSQLLVVGVGDSADYKAIVMPMRL